MKVKITGHTDPMSIAQWWYTEHIGEVFEVEPDEEQPKYYYTTLEFKGKLQKHHIMKSDCEVVERELSA